MSSRDLQAARQIEAFIKAGVSSLKIEGRMKSDYYLAVVVGAYRRLIDEIEANGTASEELLQEVAAELARAENRPAGPGFYEGVPYENVQLYRKHDETVTQEYIGLVLEPDREGYLKVQVKNHFENHTPAELFGPHTVPYAKVIDGIEDLEGNPMEVCSHPMQVVYLKWDQPALPGSMIRKQRKQPASQA